MNTMKAIVIDQYGEKENLKEMQVKIPKMNDDQVLIEMKATSINPIDWKVRKGDFKEKLAFKFPIILGWDAAGIISKVGKNVTDFTVGDKVFVRPQLSEYGTYAEYIVTDSSLLAKIPSNLSFEEAASIPLAGLTAWQSLVVWGGIRKGDRILIHGGSGGVGSLAIQIAKIFDTFVTTTSSSKNENFLKSLGADLVISYDKTDFSSVLKDYDIVLDCVGGEVQDKSFKVLRTGGKLISIVQTPDKEKASKFGVMAIFNMITPDGNQLKQLAEYLEKGTIKPIVGQIFEFNEKGIRDAHTLSESHHAKGKIVIKFN